MVKEKGMVMSPTVTPKNDWSHQKFKNSCCVRSRVIVLRNRTTSPIIFDDDIPRIWWATKVSLGAGCAEKDGDQSTFWKHCLLKNSS